MTSREFGKARATATSRYVDIDITLPTPEDAQELAAKFPKSVKAKATVLSGIYGFVSFRAAIESDEVNKGVNETGIRRYRAYRKTIAKLGIDIVFRTDAVGTITEEELEALIA